MIAPIMGVRNRLQKKYPQKPNFLLIPNRAISTVKARYIGTILMLYPGNGVKHAETIFSNSGVLEPEKVLPAR